VRLKSKGQQSRHLQEEVDRIKAIPVTETFLSDVKDAFVMLLQSRVNWEKDIENSLEKSGIQLTLLSDGLFRSLIVHENDKPIRIITLIN